MVYGERFNGWTHLAGAILALVGSVALVICASILGDPWKIVSFAVYGVTLTGLYLTSTLYHGLKGRAKRIWCKFDHCAIYLLIAGSYTPLTLVTLRGAWGWSLFGSVWGLALLGIVQEIWCAKGKRLLSLLVYVLMGWLVMIAIVPLIQSLSLEGFLWLAAGGLVYTLGIIFYAHDETWRHGHGMWHLFVLGGSACHFYTVYAFVA